MKAVLLDTSSPDADFEDYVPADPDIFCVLVEMTIGGDDGPGGENFNVVVVSPGWLASRVPIDGPLIGRHYLIVDQWDYPAIERFLKNAVEAEEADTWDELAVRLARIGHWEYEDYQDEVPG